MQEQSLVESLQSLGSQEVPRTSVTHVAFCNAGTLLCVLLPPLTIDNDSTKNSRLQTLVTSAALPLWTLSIVTTATGRVLGDAHWVSDTMAGACLGAGLVSVTTVLCSKLAVVNKQ